MGTEFILARYLIPLQQVNRIGGRLLAAAIASTIPAQTAIAHDNAPVSVVYIDRNTLAHQQNRLEENNNSYDNIHAEISNYTEMPDQKFEEKSTDKLFIIMTSKDDKLSEISENSTLLQPLNSHNRRNKYAEQKIGRPYKINGKWYVPQVDPHYDQTGQASWYGDKFHGRPTANGEIFDMHRLSAAHPTLPIPSLVMVTNLENGREIVVRVNDRGPFARNRLIDMSKRAAMELDFLDQGHAEVRVRYIGPAPELDKNNIISDSSSQSDKHHAEVFPVSTRKTTVPISHMHTLQDSAHNVTRSAPVYITNTNVSGGHYIQIGSFADIINAQNLFDVIDGSMPVSITQVQINGDTMFRVLVGPVKTRNAAEMLRNQLVDADIAYGIILSD